MTKADLGMIWSAAAGLFTVLIAASAYAKDWLMSGFRKIGASFVALVASPAVWLAVGVTFLGGCWVGHIEGGAGKRALRSEVVALELKAEAAEMEAIIAAARATSASTEGKKWKDKATALEAEVSTLRARVAGQSSPVAAVSRRPVAMVPKPETPASRPFWPFN
jgi:hypothetical protein